MLKNPALKLHDVFSTLINAKIDLFNIQRIINNIKEYNIISTDAAVEIIRYINSFESEPNNLTSNIGELLCLIQDQETDINGVKNIIKSLNEVKNFEKTSDSLYNII